MHRDACHLKISAITLTELKQLSSSIEIEAHNRRRCHLKFMPEPVSSNSQSLLSARSNLWTDSRASLAAQGWQKVAKVLQLQPKTPVLVWGDASVPYGKVVSLMAQLQTAGATSVGLVTEPEAVR